MELSHKTLRGILAQILSVDESYIVPKQGNWYNPQGAESSKPDTWCAYRIKSNNPVTAPYYDTDGDNSVVCVQKIAEIELQFVGMQAEEIAQSVSAWALRSDVKAAFQTVQGAVMYGGMNAISSPFYQDGNNTVFAWNASFKVLWVSEIKINQTQIRTINVGGQVNVK